MNVNFIPYLMCFTPDVAEITAFDMLCWEFIHDTALRLSNNIGRQLNFVGINIQKCGLEVVKMSTIE